MTDSRISPLTPRLFVASSVEARKVADSLQDILRSLDYQVQLWTEDFFQPGTSTYSAISTRIRDFDGGVFILSPDDGYLSRHGPGWTARPNVVFELGMFAGVLDIGNCMQIRLKVAGRVPHHGNLIATPRAKIEEISDLAGITWIEAEALGQESHGRSSFSLEQPGKDKFAKAFQDRRAKDSRTLSQLQRAPDIVAVWEDGQNRYTCTAILIAFGDRVRIRLLWEQTERQYDVTLKFEGEDRLSGSWWDSGDRGYAGQASFQVRSTPQYLLGQWIGWSSNGGVKSGAFLIVQRKDIEAASADHLAVSQNHSTMPQRQPLLSKDQQPH